MIVTVIRSRQKGNRIHQAIAIHNAGGESKFVDHLYEVSENGYTFLVDGGAWSSEEALAKAFEANESNFETCFHRA
jgi:hypothetical protein